MGQALEVVAFILLARQLSVADFGVLSAAFLGARLLGFVADLGLGLRGPRDVVQRSDNELDAILRFRSAWAVGIALLYGLVLFALDPALVPLAVTVLSRGALRDWLALGRGRHVAALTPILVQGLVLVVSAGAVSSLGQAACVLAVGYGAALFCSLAVTRRPRTTQPARFRPDGWALSILLAQQVLLGADVLLLGPLRSSAEAGVYAAVYRISTAVTTTASLAMSAVIAPMTRAVVQDADGTYRLAAKAGAVGGVLVAAFAPATYFLVIPAFGPDFANGRWTAVLLCLSAATWTAFAPFLAFELARGRERTAGKTLIIIAAGSVGLDLLVIPAFGINGAAAVSVFTGAVMVSTAALNSRR